MTVSELQAVVAVLAEIVQGINADDHNQEHRETIKDFLKQVAKEAQSGSKGSR